jgi:hypothetical protein
MKKLTTYQLFALATIGAVGIGDLIGLQVSGVTITPKQVSAYTMVSQNHNFMTSYTLTSVTKNENCHQFTISRTGFDFLSTKHCSQPISDSKLIKQDRPYNTATNLDLEFPKPSIGPASLKVIINYSTINIPILITKVDGCIAEYDVVDDTLDVRQGDSGAPLVDSKDNVIAVNFAIDKLESTPVENNPNLQKSKKGYALYKKCSK